MNFAYERWRIIILTLIVWLYTVPIPEIVEETGNRRSHYIYVSIQIRYKRYSEQNNNKTMCIFAYFMEYNFCTQSLQKQGVWTLTSRQQKQYWPFSPQCEYTRNLRFVSITLNKLLGGLSKLYNITTESGYLQKHVQNMIRLRNNTRYIWPWSFYLGDENSMTGQMVLILKLSPAELCTINNAASSLIHRKVGINTLLTCRHRSSTLTTSLMASKQP